MTPSETNSAGHATPDTRPRAWFTWGSIGFFVLGVAFSVGLITAIRSAHSARQPAGTLTRPVAPGQPWGELEYTSIEIERPDESLPPPAAGPPPIEWLFENQTEAQILELFAQCGLTRTQCDLLADRRFWHALAKGWMLTPPESLVAELQPEARKKLYSALGLNPKNFFRANPVRIQAVRFDHWLASCGLPEPKQGILRKLSYSNGPYICFSDCEYLEGQCDAIEKRQLAKAISRTPALVMRLRVRPHDDIDRLLQYWGRAGHTQDAKVMLRSLAKVPEGASIGVSYFLPEFVRMRLYTYPAVGIDPWAAREDCFWTAMNFFNEQPDNRFFKPELIQETLRKDYVKVESDWLLGDVLLLRTDSGTAVHMCVYIADQVVFTKNGAQTLQPWVLLRLPDMLAQYPIDPPLHMVGYRRKSLLR